MNRMTLLDALVSIKSETTRLTRTTVGSQAIALQSARQVEVTGHGTLRLTADASSQLLKWLRIDADLSRRLGPPIFSQVAEKLWQDGIVLRKIPPRLRIVQDHSGKVIGFDDPSLYTLDNSEICNVIGEAIRDDEFGDLQVRRLEFSDDGFALTATTERSVAEPRVGDIIEGGFSIKHSAIGRHATQIRHYLHRLVCNNGMTVPVCDGDHGGGMRVRRLRTEKSDRTRQIETCKTLIRASFDQLEGKLAALRTLASHRADAREVIEQLCQRHGLSQKVRKELLAALDADEMSAANDTMFDAVNAISRVATHSTATRDAIRNRLYTFAGLLAQPEHVAHCPHCHAVLYRGGRHG